MERKVKMEEIKMEGRRRSRWRVGGGKMEVGGGKMEGRRRQDGGRRRQDGG